MCKTFEELKAWSQNLDHTGMLTTLTSYGTVPAACQAEIMRALAAPNEETTALEDIVRRLVKAEIAQALTGPSGPVS